MKHREMIRHMHHISSISIITIINKFRKAIYYFTKSKCPEIEPAEPEPPPAHSIGRVGEDAMDRPGQFVKPCGLGAGGVALVVRNWW